MALYLLSAIIDLKSNKRELITSCSHRKEVKFLDATLMNLLIYIC